MGEDLQFDYLGLQTLYDRYFLHVKESRIELPQAFFMRVAMGLALLLRWLNYWKMGKSAPLSKAIPIP